MNKRLILIRKDNDMTQDQFASKLNLSKSHVSSLEVGRRPITDRIICDICREFGINEEWFRTGIGEMYRASIPNNSLAIEIAKLIESDDDWTKNAVLHFLKLSSSERDAVKKFISTLLPKKNNGTSV